MPKVIGYTPSWLSQPSSGARIFSDPEALAPPSPSKKSAFSRQHEKDSSEALLRTTTVAHRGTEVFTVVGNKIRWADLARIKEGWEQQNHKKSQNETEDGIAYRTLKTGIYYQITSLSVSPSGYFLAISTTHTVHVAILPDSKRINDPDHSEIKLKTYQLGPTTHVIPEAPLAAVLWHPLAVASTATDCLVTVTTDAAVRVWEVERTNHWSFERPALAVDLRKLADGKSSDEDFEPDGFGKNRGFSVDEFDMEAAAACFGGRGLEHEDPWAAMTLWTTMTNGDVYALCPLLPSKWVPSSTTVPALATSAVSQIAILADKDIDSDEIRAVNQRYQWVQELDDEEFLPGANNGVQLVIHARPSNPSAIPRLQGPFELPVDLGSDDAQISDILVIPANLDEDDIFSGEDDYETVGGAKSLPFTVICLATTDNKLYAMLEMEGITGQWLPRKGRSSYSTPTWNGSEFVLLETVTLQDNSDGSSSRPSFTIDPANPYLFFVTTGVSISSISLEGWASNIGIEITGQAESDGIMTRLQSACQGSICTTTCLITHDKQDSNEVQPLSTAILLDDINLGSLLLTTSAGRALAAQLGQPAVRTSQLLTNEASFSASIQSPFRASRSLMQVIETESRPLEAPPIRAPYAPSSVFYQNQMLPYQQLVSNIDPHRRPMLKEHPIRLSPACLNIMTQAHKTFSMQTSHLERAAAEVFHRCRILKEELADQVRVLVDLADSLNRLKNNDNTNDNGKTQDTEKTHSEQISERIETAQSRQVELHHRYERVRRKAGMAGHAKQELSIKERAWIDEVDTLAKHVGIQDDTGGQTQSKTGADSLTKRLENAKSLTAQLMPDAKNLQQQQQQQSTSAADSEAPESADIPGSSPGPLRTSLRMSRAGAETGMSRFQKEKITQVMDMVQREQAVIEAVQARLADLGIRA